MIKNAFAYVTRKKLKSIILLLVILSMSALCLISLSIKDATNKASRETFKNITNSFSMEINRRTNPGTPRGAGNIKGQDIKKISESENIDYYVKRINSVADLVDNDIVQTEQTLANESPERARNFKRTVMITGVNDSEKETKFVSGAFQLVEGEHLATGDKNKVLLHKDLAEKNNLKLGDTIKVKSNLFDADNEKGTDETVEVTIKGLFDGHNKGGVSVAQELYENTIITDIETAAKVYGNTEDTAVYQDATFFVKGDKNLDSVIKDLGKLDVNWREYNLIKSTSNYPALQQSISGIYSIADKLFIGSLIFAGAVVSLLLFLWMNARKKEIAVLLSLGISKANVLMQFLAELIFISIPAFIGSYFVADRVGKKLGNDILNKVTGDIAKQIARQSASGQLGGGAEVDGFNKTLTSLDINILPESMLYVVLFMGLVLVLSLAISSANIIKKNPKELLLDNNL
ncbi:MAG: FtsX-like permease family protein [Eubacteriales bacterium]|nr:FtsX-like permease family protein [Eubacteriales bacterium]